MLGFARSYDSPAVVINDPTRPGYVKTDHTPGSPILGFGPERPQKTFERFRDSPTRPPIAERAPRYRQKSYYWYSE